MKKIEPGKELFKSITIRSHEHIADAIKRIRKLHGYSQAELANRTGITQATVSRVESGSKKVEIGTLILIFAALDADLFITPRPKDKKSATEGLF